MEMLLLPEPGPTTWAEQFIASLQTERDRAAAFLAAQQARLERAETVLEEQLRQQPGKSPSTAAATAGQGRPAGGHLDWEAEKRRILAALEADFDENDANQRAERLKIQDVVRATEKIVAEKNRQILELQQQCEEAARENSAADAAAAMIDEALDGDAMVQEERQRLKELQQQWQEKLRQAEIDISVERAKLGRERTELENRIRSAANDSSQAPSEGDTSEAAAEPVGGRWLARLGLTEADRVGRRKR